MLLFKDENGNLRQITSGCTYEDVEVVQDQEKAYKTLEEIGMKPKSPVLAVIVNDK